MAVSTITKRRVDALRCPSGKDRVFLWDDELAGFGVAAMASGSKIYVIQYKRGGKTRRRKVGQHGRLTPDEARKIAKVMLGAAEDRTGRIRLEARARTFAQVAAEFMALHAKAKRKNRTAEGYERLLKTRLIPEFGATRLNLIEKQDVARFHASLNDSPGAANRSVALFSTVWNWAAKRGEVEKADNPASGLERYPEHPRERYLTQAELKRLGNALERAATVGLPWNVDESKPRAKHTPKKDRITVIDPYAVAAIRLLILTGARLREILHARWDYVDWDRGVMFLPDSKTGRKTLYLPEAAREVLRGIKRQSKIPFIIAGAEQRNGKGERVYKPRADLKRPWAAIANSAGLIEHVQKGDKLSNPRPSVRLHDLRHTFAATGAGLSLGLPMIGRLLGHSQPSTTQRYAHIDADPAHKAANLIANQISAALASRK
jgi:integrase